MYPSIKKWIIFVLTIFLLAGCRSQSDEQDVTKILVGTDGDTKPYTYFDENNELTGYDIAVVKAIDEMLPQYEISFEVTEFTGIFAGIDSSRYQMAANNITKNPERESKYLFGNQSYLYNNAVIAVQSDRTDIQSLDDLGGKTTVIKPSGSFQQAFVENYNATHPDNPILFTYSDQDYLKTYQDIMQGHVDFALAEEIMINSLIDEYQLDLDVISLPYEQTIQIMQPEGFFVFPRTQEGEALRDAFDEAIVTLIENGTLSELSNTYLGRDYVGNITINQSSETTTESMPNLFDIGLVFSNIPQILVYLPTTLWITLISAIFSFLLGFVIAMVKHKHIPILTPIFNFYVSFMRGTPLLVQLYLTFYGIPILLQYINYYQGTNYSTNSIPPMLFVIIAFSLNEAAYSSESIRAGLEAVDPGEQEAALAMGMSPLQTFIRITLPEALVIALPALGNSLVGLIKGTSLAFTCAVIDITAGGKLLASRNFRYFESYISVALIYWVLTIVISWLLKKLEKKLKADEQEEDGKHVESPAYSQEL